MCQLALQASVIAAMSLIKSLLATAEQQGSTPEGAGEVLKGCSQDDIIAAFGHLIRLGHVYNGQFWRPFHLTKRFHASLQAWLPVLSRERYAYKLLPNALSIVQGSSACLHGLALHACMCELTVMRCITVGPG